VCVREKAACRAHTSLHAARRPQRPHTACCPALPLLLRPPLQLRSSCPCCCPPRAPAPQPPHARRHLNLPTHADARACGRARACAPHLVDVRAAVGRHVHQRALLDLPHRLVQPLELLGDVQVLHAAVGGHLRRRGRRGRAWVQAGVCAGGADGGLGQGPWVGARVAAAACAVQQAWAGSACASGGSAEQAGMLRAGSSVDSPCLPPPRGPHPRTCPPAPSFLVRQMPAHVGA